jgi:hypothetical protein
MDVLKEIQQAEAQAREIEREYAEKAKTLAAETAARLERRRADGEGGLERDLAALKDSLARELERDKTAASAGTHGEIESIAARLKSRADAAAAIILSKAGFPA